MRMSLSFPIDSRWGSDIQNRCKHDVTATHELTTAGGSFESIYVRQNLVLWTQSRNKTHTENASSRLCTVAHCACNDEGISDSEKESSSASKHAPMAIISRVSGFLDGWGKSVPVSRHLRSHTINEMRSILKDLNYLANLSHQNRISRFKEQLVLSYC